GQPQGIAPTTVPVGAIQGECPKYLFICASVLITTPNGLSGVVTTEKTAKLAESGAPLSLLSLTTQITTNDRTSQSVYDATNKTLTAKSAAGRKSVSIFDDKGRVIQKQVLGLADVFYTYDSRGRLTQVIEGECDDGN
ncbi:MAG: hypothetical protein DRQ99_24625, partial [Candidatus Parabeggiatoa sp. nov. 3]